MIYGENNAETIVLLHGWADSAWSMDTVAQPLAATHRVVSVDLRGHGRSDRGPYNMIHLIGDLVGVFDSLDASSPIVMGHSLGGQVAAQFCGLYPGLASALVLIEGMGPPAHRLAASEPDELERMSARMQVERVRARPTDRAVADLVAATERLSIAHPLLDPARAAFLAERNTAVGDDGQLRWRHDPASRDWLNGHSGDLAAIRWRGITCPVMVINGAEAHARYWKFLSEHPDDYPEPLAGDALAARLANFQDVRYEEIVGAGHMLPYDKPDALNDVIARFVAEMRPES